MASKELIIIRHSFAEDEVAGLGDKSRPLSTRGIEKLVDIKATLTHYKPEYILVSPATRTVETLQCLIDESSYLKTTEHPALYYGGLDDYIECLDSLPIDTQRVWLIGHNPMVTYLGQRLSEEFNEGFTPGMAIILRHNQAWKDIGNIKWQLVEIIN